jgi:hypothetical protein
MWNWFKRLRDPDPTPEELARARAARRGGRSRRERTTEPASLQRVEVSEGNTQADWSAWEDSMTVLDSQMGDLQPSQRVYEREGDSRFTRPGPLLDDNDVFGKVRKNSDI